jgi:hypothetical protein
LSPTTRNDKATGRGAVPWICRPASPAWQI